MGSPSRNVQYHPPRLSEDRLNLAQPHSPSLPTHCSGKSGMRPRPLRQWRHLPWGRKPAWLRYAPWRVSCRQCGVRVERVSWAAGNSAFTAPFEELAAYLAQVTHRKTVSRVQVQKLTLGPLGPEPANRRPRLVPPRNSYRLARTIHGDRDLAPGRRHRNRTRSRTTGNEQWAAAGTSQPRVAGWLSAEWT